jgi:peptidoglycan/xylan/chitin deacetylase (PgdA/CDA1 family)
MTIQLLDSAYNLVTRLRERAAPRSLILMYHRVTKVTPDPWSLSVEPANFEAHLQHLRRHFQILPLQHLVRMQKENRVPERAIAITFDDGYADNLYNAHPLLSSYELPAAFFVASGYLGQDREFWWDELDKYVLESRSLPETLRLEIRGKYIEWHLLETVQSASRPPEHRPPANWRGITAISRQALYQDLWKRLYPLTHHQRQPILGKIASWAGVSTTARESHRIMNQEELTHFAREPLVTIGGHTVTHLSLSAHPVALQLKEIQENKRYLEKLLRRPVTTFSYPHGDYTFRTLQLLRSAGFEYACTTGAQPLWPHSNQFRLPRYPVENWNQEEFARQLDQWLL